MFDEISLETIRRSKRGIINGLGSVWKVLTGNLDASDGEYYNKCIDQLENDDKEMQRLLKEQISVATQTIKNFNFTIRKLQIDEETFNSDIKIIESKINGLTTEQEFLEHQLKLINACEQLLESYTLIRNELSDIIESLTFSKLKVVHPSIIKPQDLFNQLLEISGHLSHNNLPFKSKLENLPNIINLITLTAFQTSKRLIFILHIPLIESESFSLYHLYSIPINNTNNDLFHTIIPETKYIGISEDNRQYVRINSLDQCKQMDEQSILCKNLIPLETRNAPCEVHLITQLQTSEKCVPVFLKIEDFNIQIIGKNRWILILPQPMAFTYICPGSTPNTQLFHGNKIISLQPRCSAYIGNNQIFAEEDNTSNITEENFIPQIPFDCCEQFIKTTTQIKLKPLKINHLNLDDLNVADHKLNEIKEELESMENQPFASRYLSISTILVITAISTIIFCCICYKCGCCRFFIGYFKPSNYPGSDDDRNKSCCPQIFNFCNVQSRTVARRPSIHLSNIEETRVEYHDASQPLRETSRRRL